MVPGQRYQCFGIQLLGYVRLNDECTDQAFALPYITPECFLAIAPRFANVLELNERQRAKVVERQMYVSQCDA